GTANYVNANCASQGYPCTHQPGRVWSGALAPLYGWNNRETHANTVVDLVAETDGVTTFVAPNRDIFTEPSPAGSFNGTVGVGFGTLAARPATCTHSNATFPTLPADGTNGGVGYFATDVGSQGTLYRCSATNTWTVQYAPYTYPHLVSQASFSASSGDLNADSTTNVADVQLSVNQAIGVSPCTADINKDGLCNVID